MVEHRPGHPQLFRRTHVNPIAAREFKMPSRQDRALQDAAFPPINLCSLELAPSENKEQEG